MTQIFNIKCKKSHPLLRLKFNPLIMAVLLVYCMQFSEGVLDLNFCWQVIIFHIFVIFLSENKKFKQNWFIKSTSKNSYLEACYLLENVMIQNVSTVIFIFTELAKKDFHNIWCNTSSYIIPPFFKEINDQHFKLVYFL